MFIGEYSSQLGEKNRIAIPKKLRDGMGGSIYITRGYENTLLMTDSERWDVLVSEINTNPLFSLTNRELKRFIIGGAIQVLPDSQGRFVLSDALKTFAGISESVVFVGVGEWIEIWDESKWNLYLKDIASRAGKIANNMYSDLLNKQ